MGEIVLELPVGVAMEFPGRNATNPDVWGLLMADLLAPRDTDLCSELGDVLVILKVCPKINLCAGFLC